MSSSLSFAVPSARGCKLFQPIKTSARRPEATASTSGQADRSSNINTSEITLKAKDDKTIKAYLASPSVEPSSKAGIVLVSDIFGCDAPQTRKVADLLASNSFPTIIPDIFREDPWPEKPLDDEFKAWLGKQSIDRVHSDIEVAVEALRDRGFGKPLGLVGFCFGGARVMDQIGMVEDGVDPEAAAAFYPVGFDAADVGKKAKCPLLLIAGDSDPMVPMELIETLRDTLEMENNVMPDCEIIIAEGARHGFVHRPRTEEDEADSGHLQNQVVEWMRKFLLSE